MQTLSLIPECVLSLSTKEEGSIMSYEDLVALRKQEKQEKTLYLPEHEHATRVVYLDDQTIAAPPAAGDIVVTNSKRACIAHQFADCVPFVCIDRKKKAFVFSHLGWKGLTMGGVQVSVLALQNFVHSSLQDLWVWIGPCIQKESYLFDVQPVQARLPQWRPCIEELAKGDAVNWSIDLPGFIINQCSQIGIDPEQIINDGRDTYTETEVFFSHKRYIDVPETERGTFVVSCALE